jgi:two-component system, OmpR family, sensor kinase
VSIRRWWLIALPLILGIAAMALLNLVLAPAPILVVRIDIGTALALFGWLVSAFLLVHALTRHSSELHCEQTLATERQQQEEAHRRFLRRLDHELKNPLTAMRAALVNLSDAAGSSPRNAAIADMQRQAERLSRLVSDLRKLAELEVRPLESLPVDTGELLQEVVEAARSQPAYAGRQIRLVVPSVPWPPPPITGDRDLLSLAFYNLLENALKFTGPDDTVEVRAAEDGQTLTVEVADTGPGIDPEDLPRLFEELYRGSNARGFEGSGLGLALVQRVIARHAGQVSVRSRQDKHRGTLFTVHLPISKDSERVTKP